MDAKKVLSLSSLDDFFTLDRVYKWIIYFFGWLVIISSFIFIAFIIILYFFRDKTIKRKNEKHLYYGYQRLPYLVGWACSLIVIALVLIVGGLWLGQYLCLLFR